MGCHSAKYMRWGRLSDDLGIPEDLAHEHLILGENTKFGALMEIAMTENYGKQAFGVSPPDLTLVARSRSPEWLYTYLTTFYVDPDRPYGVNNLVFKDVGMPMYYLTYKVSKFVALQLRLQLMEVLSVILKVFHLKIAPKQTVEE